MRKRTEWKLTIIKGEFTEKGYSDCFKLIKKYAQKRLDEEKKQRKVKEK